MQFAIWRWTVRAKGFPAPKFFGPCSFCQLGTLGCAVCQKAIHATSRAVAWLAFVLAPLTLPQAPIFHAVEAVTTRQWCNLSSPPRASKGAQANLSVAGFDLSA